MRPRILRDVSKLDMSVSLLGEKVAFSVGVALMGNTVLWGWLMKSADKIAVSAEYSPDHGECEAIKVPKFSWLPFHHKKLIVKFAPKPLNAGCQYV